MARGSSSSTESEETVETVEAPAEEQVEEAPKPRYFSISIELQLVTDDQDVSAEAVEAAAKEQIVLPANLSLQPGSITVLGATSGGTSESSSPTEINGGYGREEPPKEE